MKRAIIGSLLVLSLASYKSAAEAEQATVESTTATSTGKVETENEPNSEQATSEEIEEIVRETEFTSKELKKATKNLGYRCTMVARTGSHIKKKMCTTAQQRKVLAEAARQYLQDARRTQPVKKNKRGN